MVLKLEFSGGPFQTLRIATDKGQEPFTLGHGGLWFLMGVSGSGKTLLAWVLYYAPLVAISAICRSDECRDYWRTFARQLSFLTLSYGFRKLVENSRFSLCSEIDETIIRKLSFAPAAIRYACIEYDKGYTRVSLETKEGRIERVGDREKALEVAEHVVLAWSYAFSIPVHLRSALYTLRVESYRDLADIVKKLVQLEPREVGIEGLFRRIICSRMPPYALHDHEAFMELAEIFPVLMDAIKLRYDREERLAYSRLATGRIQMKIVRYLRSLIRRTRLETQLRPIMYIDEPFEGLPLKNAVETAKQYHELSQSAHVILTSHRPEAFLAKNIVEAARPFVATYNLRHVSEYIGIEPSKRLIIVDISTLSERAWEEVYRTFIAPTEVTELQSQLQRA